MSLLVARTKVASEMRVRVKTERAKKTVHVDEVNLSNLLSNLLSKTIQALAPPFSERLQQLRSSRRAGDIDL
jgi:C4-dicarboxylate-specific signal transduction histidine kinase